MKQQDGGRPNMEQSVIEKMHQRLRCYGCKFADKEALGKDACCKYNGRIEVDEEGRCKMQEETSSRSWMD